MAYKQRHSIALKVPIKCLARFSSLFFSIVSPLYRLGHAVMQVLLRASLAFKIVCLEFFARALLNI